jgi:hypothetical protein
MHAPTHKGCRQAPTAGLFALARSELGHLSSHCPCVVGLIGSVLVHQRPFVKPLPCDTSVVDLLVDSKEL